MSGKCHISFRLRFVIQVFLQGQGNRSKTSSNRKVSISVTAEWFPTSASKSRGVWANWKADESPMSWLEKPRIWIFIRLFKCLVCWKLNKWSKPIRILDVEQYEVDKGKMVLQKYRNSRGRNALDLFIRKAMRKGAHGSSVSSRLCVFMHVL